MALREVNGLISFFIALTFQQRILSKMTSKKRYSKDIKVFRIFFRQSRAYLGRLPSATLLRIFLAKKEYGVTRVAKRYQTYVTA